MGIPVLYSVFVHFAPPSVATPWHPTTSEGPFAVLTRGAFETTGEAHAWARRNLNGTRYDVAPFVAYHRCES